MIYLKILPILIIVFFIFFTINYFTNFNKNIFVVFMMVNMGIIAVDCCIISQHFTIYQKTLMTKEDKAKIISQSEQRLTSLLSVYNTLVVESVNGKDITVHIPILESNTYLEETFSVEDFSYKNHSELGLDSSNLLLYKDGLFYISK